jgi:hypothetical protein
MPFAFDIFSQETSEDAIVNLAPSSTCKITFRSHSPLPKFLRRVGFVTWLVTCPNVVSQVTRMSVEVLVTQSAFADSIVLIEGNNNKKANTNAAIDTMPFLLKRVSEFIFRK